MSQWILSDNIKVIPVVTACKLTKEELPNESERRKHDKFDRAIESKYRSSTKGLSQQTNISGNNEAYPCPDKDLWYDHLPTVDDYNNYDEYVNMEVFLP